MAIAIFGGTFDPFHKAHKRMVKELVKSKRFRSIYVIPAGFSPHKAERSISFSSYRYVMTNLALAKYPEVIVSDYELKKTEKTYTYNTIKEFRETIIDDTEEIYLAIGSDSFISIESWFSFSDLIREVTLFVAKRPGTDNEFAIFTHKNKLEKLYQAKIEFFDMRPMEISSTEIRASIQQGEQSIPEVPKKVLDFVHTHQLYQDNPLEVLTDEQFLILRNYELKLMALMSYPRLIHSLNVMFESVRLARRFSVDPWKAAVAGLLHDAAKEQDYRKFPEVLDRLDPETLANRSIIHGPVGASFMMELFSITDPAIRDAIYYHSTLSPVPSVLEKVVYLADKIEPAREYMDLEPIRDMAKVDLDQAVLLTIDAIERFMDRSRGKMHGDTKRAREYILKNTRNNKNI